MTAKRIAVLFIALFILALPAGCSDSAASTDTQIDSIRVVKLSWSHPVPADDNTHVYVDADEIQELIVFFNELDCYEKYEDLDAVRADDPDILGGCEIDVDFMSNGSSVRRYVMWMVLGPLLVQLEPDGKIYQMSEEAFDWWCDFDYAHTRGSN